MKIYEFGAQHDRTFVMFPCAAEPWWVFRESAEAMARDYHVYLVIADGHDEQDTTFVSIEKNVSDAAAYLHSKGVRRIDGLYGVSMGGASVIRFLATVDIPVEKAIIDAGITPYPYPKWVCRLIAMKDWVTVMLGTKSYALMKLAMPPKRWTPAGQDPERHYRRIFDFEKHHFSSRTIWHVFWGTNNYAMPDPVPKVGAKIEYWYGEEERKARKNNLAYALKVYPRTVPREFKGLAHTELVMMFPERFYKEVTRFLREE